MYVPVKVSAGCQSTLDRGMLEAAERFQYGATLYFIAFSLSAKALK